MSFGPLLHVLGPMQTKVLIKSGAFLTQFYGPHTTSKYSGKTDTNFGMDIEVGRWKKSLLLVGCHLLCSTNTDKCIGRIQI